MKRRTGYNPKRSLVPLDELVNEERTALSQRVSYTGNPDHKRSPGDFDLTPPSSPRPGATLCDEAGIFEKAVAAALLEEGIQRGLVSRQRRGGWPQNVWSVRAGVPFEAELETELLGQYHGYPLPNDDPFRMKVLTAWAERLHVF